MSSDSPFPLEKGDLDPPKRHPPTAVGTATPPPPPRPRRPWRSLQRALRPLYLFGGGLITGGFLLRLASSWLAAHPLGEAALPLSNFFIGFGAFFVLLILSIQFDLRGRIDAWRRKRAIRRQVLASRTRPSA